MALPFVGEPLFYAQVHRVWQICTLPPFDLQEDRGDVQICKILRSWSAAKYVQNSGRF